MIKRLLLILLWVISMVMAAKYIPNWRHAATYDDLITPQAVTVLSAQQTLKITVFALPDSPAAVLVKNFLQPLSTHLADVEVDYLDMNQHAALVDQYNIRKQGEMIIANEKGEFQLATLSYEAFFNGLKSISQNNNDDWLVFLDGQGSKSFAKDQLSGLNMWINALSQANYKSIVLPFDAKLRLPKQTKLLVLASPQEPLNEAQMAWLEQTVMRGISLLWLVDPETIQQQPQLALMFDVMRTDAYHQGQLVLKNFPNHDINRNFDRPLDLSGVLPFSTSSQVLWQNTQGQTLAATQELNGARLMVVGDSDFLNNAQIDSGGNLEMSYRMVDWLLRYDDRIDLPTIGNNGTQLYYERGEVLWFSGIMLLFLPAVFLLLAVIFWRKNK
ncbi:Gldg family protein [Marinicella sp. S1101]|uniref:Gldg family protein n=1 Tax=Marinicella marina TaxID=2996016 RepID=UPI0022609F7C|nr:DUF4350 domain-containing protein [Marinicella marina]MCX7555200.1 Gldg family protein [Marinicella marina]MDJ1140756.1 Gldg family protein [Marinicella marina]